MLYIVTFTINLPQMLAYIYHTWILWVIHWGTYLNLPCEFLFGGFRAVDSSMAEVRREGPRFWGMISTSADAGCYTYIYMILYDYIYIHIWHVLVCMYVSIYILYKYIYVYGNHLGYPKMNGLECKIQLKWIDDKWGTPILGNPHI